MSNFSMIFSFLVCAIAIYVLYELTRVAKHLNGKEYSYDRNDIILLIITLFLIIIIVPYIFTLPIFSGYNGTSIDGGTGQIGDTIGGLTAPFINGIAAILVYVAFKEQIKANKAQTLQFNKQDNDNKINRFENKFYELIRLHKQNIEEISIEGYEGNIEKRKSFVSMYKEFQYTFFIVKKIHGDLNFKNPLLYNYKDEKLLRLAYVFFYVGVGHYSEKVSKVIIGQEFDTTLYDGVNQELLKIQKHLKENPFNILDNSEYAEVEYLGLGKAVLPTTYPPFEGHLSRFGHYYRHLFQTVKFVVNQNKDLIDDTQKLEYLRTLRAQLSDHEQVMLYYNAISEFGKAWLDNKYFTDYKMIHNIPLPLADFGIKPQEKFEKEIDSGIDMFEWLPRKKTVDYLP